MNKKDLLYVLSTGPALALFTEAQFGVIGVQQQIGRGKNLHTVNPQPITWENYPGLDYEIDSGQEG